MPTAPSILSLTSLIASLRCTILKLGSVLNGICLRLVEKCPLESSDKVKSQWNQAHEQLLTEKHVAMKTLNLGLLREGS